MNILRSSLKIFSARSLNVIIGFIGIVYFAGILGPEQIGTFFLFQALLAIFSIFGDIGIDDGLEKRISEKKAAGRYLSSGIILKLAVMLLVCIIILMFRNYINQYLGSPLAFLLAIGMILREGMNTTIKVLNGEHRVGETAILELIYQVMWVGLGAIFLYFGYDSRGIIYSLLIGYGCSLIWGIMKISITIRPPSFEFVSSLFDYSKFQFISRLGGEVFNWMDIFFIGLFLTQTEVGQYEIAWRVATVVIVFSRSLSASIFPKISYMNENDNIGKVNDIIPGLITLSVILVIPAFFGTLVYSQEILKYVFGDEYASARLVLILLMSYKPFQAVQAILGRTLLAIDKPDLAARATIISIIINILANIILIPRFGIAGAAVATILASLVSDALHYWYLSEFITIHIQIFNISWSILASLGMTVLLYWLGKLILIDNLTKLLLMISLGVCVYAILLITYSPIRRQLKVYIHNLRK
ncbi:polysaccharide biosynthesis C-terminal domain-containing protein [Halorubrum sp. CGM4_25_10-8A]|uniref:oligosaccharide flippase family protein n=1 Tax=Halorubrum sp. CGM4_25_10-8A TaxID=2518116 RepID=UPI0010F4BA91|nr:polysaccharide biosynthesis C-terminal domain-containing protein [Halorubrum sp. CGM4_25_10-8A]TKX40346.1 flippase [Halorubrum sp. CGM4_25_10-8A]